MSLKILEATQKMVSDTADNPIKKAVNTFDSRVKELNGILGTAVSAVDGTFNSKEIFNKLTNDVAKKYGIDSALSSINQTMGLVKSFELAFRGVPNDGSPKANYTQTTNVAQYQYPSDLGGIYFQIGLKEWKKLSAFGKNTMDTKASIALPLPRNLVEQHSVGYKQYSLGALMGGFKQRLLGASNNENADFYKRAAVSAAAVVTEGVLRGVEGQLVRELDKISMASGGLGSGLAEGAGSIVTTGTNQLSELKEQGVLLAEQSLGMAFNPNLTLILSGPELRSHQFTWIFAAKNYEESKQIKSIIHELRKAMLPSSADGLIYKYPNYALLRIHPQNDFLYKFKPCVITGMAVNYSGAGSPSFMPGKETGNHPPTVIELTLSFQEVEVIIRENVESGDEFLSSATKGGDDLAANYKEAVFDTYEKTLKVFTPSLESIPFGNTVKEKFEGITTDLKTLVRGDGPNG